MSSSTKYPASTHIQKTAEKLIEILPESDRSRTHVLYLTSEHVTYRHDTDRELSFRQESNFFYLTGCNVPGSSLVVIVPGKGSPITQTLYIPPEDPLDTMWSPPPPTIVQACDTHDFPDIQHTTTLCDALMNHLTTYTDAILHVLPSVNFPPLPQDISSKFEQKFERRYLLFALHQARLIKTPEEIALIRKANAISSRAHEVVIRLLGRYADGLVHGPHPGAMPDLWRIEKEQEAEAVFVASCRREGAVHQAYLPIVASNRNAATLHYCCNDREFAWGPATPHTHSDLEHEMSEYGRKLAPQVLLIDAGCEWNNYASDITRTTPVGNNGRFTEESRNIYSLVLKMQQEAIESLKPGLHWDSVQYQCHITLIRGFLSLGIFTGDENEIVKSGISAAFFPHGVGHSLGLDVHDVPSASKPESNATIPARSAENPSFYTYLRLRLPLEAGMVLTVEPGIYFQPHLLAPVRGSPFVNHEVLERYERVGGVRIEDVLVITPDGCENLTTVGKEVNWVEQLSSGEI
jgi:Xaa-Pro dipeptidase